MEEALDGVDPPLVLLKQKLLLGVELSLEVDRLTGLVPDLEKSIFVDCFASLEH